MSLPRLFLVAHEMPLARAEASLRAACQAGDVASLLIPPGLARSLTPVAQSLGIAVLLDGEAREAMHAGCDGVLVDATAEDADIAGLRKSIGRDRIIGAYAGASRHYAMEAAEAGADFVALDQTGPTTGGEPIVSWCAAFLNVPCVAFRPCATADLDTLLPQKPDFIRPADAMWTSETEARRVVSELTQRLTNS
ncbi:MAG: thiamine phosphate synthase [Hyphomicrobiales bacterium]